MSVAGGVFPSHIPGVGGSVGLTKRELFAAVALQGLIACRQFDSTDSQYTARLARAHADALLAELAKPPAG